MKYARNDILRIADVNTTGVPGSGKTLLAYKKPNSGKLAMALKLCWLSQGQNHPAILCPYYISLCAGQPRADLPQSGKPHAGLPQTG
jgi:hypothetical protein